jgi:hypothetical protein
MLKNVFFILLIANCFQLKAQTSGAVMDSLGMPIPYVNIWVDGENIGTTSEEDGTFTLNSSEEKVLVFSAVGFTTKKVNSLDVKTVILKASLNKLEEVNVFKRKGTEEIVIGKFKKKDIKSFRLSTTEPLIMATKIEPSSEVEKHPFIKAISFATYSNLENAKVNLRFFEVDKEGNPGNDFLQQNVLVKIRKGRNSNTVVLDTINLKLPKEGIFIAVEWLIIKDNKFEKELKYGDNLEYSETHNLYQPGVGVTSGLTQKTWFFAKGRWIKEDKQENNLYFNPATDNRYEDIAISLKLTN